MISHDLIRTNDINKILLWDMDHLTHSGLADHCGPPDWLVLDHLFKTKIVTFPVLVQHHAALLLVERLVKFHQDLIILDGRLLGFLEESVGLFFEVPLGHEEKLISRLPFMINVIST